MSSVSLRAAELLTGTPRLQWPRPLPTTLQPSLMLSHIHALSHVVVTTARSGSPGEHVVYRQRLSVCGSERQDILFHENSCEPIMVEVRKGSSSSAFLPQERGVSVISPPTPPPGMHLYCLYKTWMSSSSYRTCPKGTVWAHTPRDGCSVSMSSQRTGMSRYTQVSSTEGKRAEGFSEKSSRYRDSLKSEVWFPRD